MTDEEKKAIKDCDTIFICLDDYMSKESANDYRISYLTLTNLIEKQSKEIEELKMQLEVEKIDNKYNKEEAFEEMIPRYKIKAKIEEIEKEIIEDKKKNDGFWSDYSIYLDAQREGFQSLLEKE